MNAALSIAPSDNNVRLSVMETSTTGRSRTKTGRHRSWLARSEVGGPGRVGSDVEVIAVDLPRERRVVVVIPVGSEPSILVSQQLVGDRPGITYMAASWDERLSIEGALTDGYTLSTPIHVHMWLEGEDYVADAEDLSIYAFGSTRDQALGNLKARIVEQYRRLGESGERLSAPMVAVAQRIQAAVVGHDA